MADVKFTNCVICEENKPSVEVQPYKPTGELICYDCRIEMLDEEFKNMWKVKK